ncbi:hypothetical protein Tco_0251641 [Tanacetum coccineum]
MRLKSKVLASPMDSSTPMVFVAGLSYGSSPTAPTGLSAPPGFPMHAQVPLYYTARPAQPVSAQSTSTAGQATVLPHAFTVGTLQDPSSGAWNMDTVGDGHSIPITNIGHSILPTPLKSLRLNNVLITPHIVKNLIFVRQFVLDNDCTLEFDSFGFSVKDFMTRRVLLRCDSTKDLYPITTPSPIPHAFLVS